MHLPGVASGARRADVPVRRDDSKDWHLRDLRGVRRDDGLRVNDSTYWVLACLPATVEEVAALTGYPPKTILGAVVDARWNGHDVVARRDLSLENVNGKFREPGIGATTVYDFAP